MIEPIPVIRQDFDRVAFLPGGIFFTKLSTWDRPILLGYPPVPMRELLVHAGLKNPRALVIAVFECMKKHKIRSFYKGCINFSKYCGVK